MPAKRKASASQTLDEPDATRRRTRSNAANLDPSGSQQRVLRSAPNTPARSAPSPGPTRKAREKLLTRSQAKASPVVRSESSHVNQKDPASEDELLLFPDRKATKKRGPETVSSKPSRVYVEIISPVPHPSKRLQAKINTDPSSPTPTRSKAVPRIPPSPSRSPISLKKLTTDRISPSKLLGQSTPRGIHSRITKNPPGHGCSPRCLHAQKRSIFHALHDPKTAVFDEEDENEAPSANAVVLEQLKALLTGTLERGEGNSCLLIGPRGSGKSRVSSIYASGTDTA